MEHTAEEYVSLGSVEVVHHPQAVLTENDAIKRRLSQYPSAVPLNVQIPKMGQRISGKTLPVPLYAAGFYMDVHWFRNVYMKRLNYATFNEIIWDLRKPDEAYKVMHPSTHVYYSWDDDGTVFFRFCTNSRNVPHRKWAEEGQKNFDILCEHLHLEPAEKAQAKKAFQWYMMKPEAFSQVPDELKVRG